MRSVQVKIQISNEISALGSGIEYAGTVIKPTLLITQDYEVSGFSVISFHAV